LVKRHCHIHTGTVWIHDCHTEILRETAAAVDKKNCVRCQIRWEHAGLCRAASRGATSHPKIFKHYETAGRCCRSNYCVTSLHWSAVIMSIALAARIALRNAHRGRKQQHHDCSKNSSHILCSYQLCRKGPLHKLSQ